MDESPANSKVSRVQPVFGWLRQLGGADWPYRLVSESSGLAVRPLCGRVEQVHLDPEYAAPPTTARLAWMIRNISRLVPQDGKVWRQPYDRVSDADQTAKALKLLDAGEHKGIPRELVFEAASHADCLIECEKAVIWIEGKRFDWISPCQKWDVTRDQISRNLEAVWSLAAPQGKDYCMIICHEHPLKHHEQLLVDGYRAGTWVGGWPHLSQKQRREFGLRIGTLNWSRMTELWPGMLELPELGDLGSGYRGHHGDRGFATGVH